MRTNYISILLILLTSACIERIEAPIIEAANVLVVDGLITNDPGPHSVRLLYSSNLDEDLDRETRVPDATVSITEDNLAEYLLTETKPGIYETPATFKGKIGSIYKLAIETTDGKKYESTPAIMRDPGSLDGVTGEFRENVINQTDPVKPQDAFFLYARSASSSSVGSDLLRWRWNATYQIHTDPENRTIPSESGPIPSPPRCAVPCTCCDCWMTFHNETVSLSNPDIAGNSFNKVFLGMIPVQSMYFYEKLLVRVDQLSLSEEAYSFWKLVKAQQESAGNLFQPQVVKVKGNVFSVNNPDEEVFGIFSVSGVTHNQISLTLSDIPKRIPGYTIVKDSCQYSGGTNVRPPFY